MVPTGLRRHRRGLLAARTATGAAALILASCGGERPAPAADPAEEFARRVRAEYTAQDVIAAGAWTLEAGPGELWVLVDVQSAVEGLVQARLDLWLASESTLTRVARSDVMPAAAEIGAYAFEEITGDEYPDLLGWVADSAGTGYVVFIPGARAGMADELEAAAPGWRFPAEADSLAGVGRAPDGRACYLRIWAEAPAPDGRGDGWRYVPVVRGGRLGRPTTVPPACGTGPG